MIKNITTVIILALTFIGCTKETVNVQAEEGGMSSLNMRMLGEWNFFSYDVLNEDGSLRHHNSWKGGFCEDNTYNIESDSIYGYNFCNDIQYRNTAYTMRGDTMSWNLERGGSTEYQDYVVEFKGDTLKIRAIVESPRSRGYDVLNLTRP